MRWAAVESPYGPAPTTTASYCAAGTDRCGIFVSFAQLTRATPERGRLSPQHLAQRGTREIGGGSRGGTQVLPIEVIVAHRSEERGTEVQDRPEGGWDPRAAAFSDRGGRRREGAPEVTHPAARAIPVDLVNRLPARPPVYEKGEIDSGPHGHFDGRGEARVDLHEVRNPVAVPPELDFGVAIEVDLADEPFRLVPGVGRHRDALSEDRVPSERRIRSLRPLREPGVDLAVRVQEAHRLPSAGNERLEQGDPAEARVLGDGSERLPRSRHEAGHHAGSLSLGADPRFTRLDDRREPDVLQGAGNIIGSSDRNAGRHRDSKSLRNRERLLLVDRDGHRGFIRERDADAAFQPRAMSASEGNRAVMRGDQDARPRSIQDLLQVAQVRVRPVGPGRDKALRAPARGKCRRVAGGVQLRNGEVPPAEGAHGDERLPRARIEDQRVDGRRELDLLVPLGTKDGGLKRWEYKRCGFIRGWRPTRGIGPAKVGSTALPLHGLQAEPVQQVGGDPRAFGLVQHVVVQAVVQLQRLVRRRCVLVQLPTAFGIREAVAGPVHHEERERQFASPGLDLPHGAAKLDRKPSRHTPLIDERIAVHAFDDFRVPREIRIRNAIDVRPRDDFREERHHANAPTGDVVGHLQPGRSQGESLNRVRIRQREQGHNRAPHAVPQDEEGAFSLPFADPHDKRREVRDVFGEGPDVGARAFGPTVSARSNAYTAKPASPSCRANVSYRELWSLSPCTRINAARGGSDGNHDCSNSCKPPRPWNALSEWLTGTKGRPPGFPELLLANELSASPTRRVGVSREGLSARAKRLSRGRGPGSSS